MAVYEKEELKRKKKLPKESKFHFSLKKNVFRESFLKTILLDTNKSNSIF